MDEKYDLRRHCFALALVKEKLVRIIDAVDDSDLDWPGTGEIAKDSAQEAIELLQTMIELMAEEHPEFRK